MTEPGPKAAQNTAFLDRPAARGVAALVLLLVAASLGWIHSDDLFPPEQAAVPADDPVALCVAQRSADIDKMLADGVIQADQATLFKGRAEALCQAQEGQGAGPPPVPSQ